MYRVYYRDKNTQTIDCVEYERQRDFLKVCDHLDETGKSFLYATKVNDRGIDTDTIELYSNDMIQCGELYANNQGDSGTADNNS